MGYLGLKEYGLNSKEFGIFLETAHPVKFLDIVEETLRITADIPEQIQDVLHKDKKYIFIQNYDELKRFLIS